MLTKVAKQKYPYSDIYVDNLKDKKMNEGIVSETNYLNECSICTDPFSTSERLGISFLSSLNPTTILGGVLGYVMSGDQCSTKAREAESRYTEFSSKL